jgi:alginate O-acetyltransferase complex protein AlgI
MHYALERYKGTLDKHGFKEFLGYLFFLPTIVIGPINRFGPFLRDVRRQRWDGSLMSEGLERILYGYVKITVLGNFLVASQLGGWIETLRPDHPVLGEYLGVVRYGLNSYLQFAGFSDVAIGFALLLGYRVIENFDWPYLRTNISAFWRSWHISLTSWCRDYVYGSVFAVSRSPALGALATLVVVGLWHEISVRYLLWGVYHGVGLIVWQRFQDLKRYLPTVTHPLGRRAIDGLSILLTVHFVWFSFVLVSQPTLAMAWQVYRTILFWWMA